MDRLIRKYEGCRLASYKCPAGIWTIGWGTTYYPDGKSVKEGETISQEKADALLIDYLNKNIVPVFQKIPYTLTIDQKAAIASLCYNVGVPSFLRSKCFTAVCNKDFAGIFENWDWGHKQLKGLAKRRAEELFYFLKDL
jgi:lysozyme